MTPELAQELADVFCNADPLAAPMILRMSHGDPEERTRAQAAVKLLWPSLLGQLTPEQLKPERKLRSLWEGTKGAIDELDRFTQADFSDRTTTGIPQLDRRLRGGLKAGQMTLLGAPTGAGKTSLVQQIAVAAAEQGRGSVLFVSPEMSLESLAEREIVRRSGRPLWDRNPWLGNGPLRDSCIGDHARAASELLLEKLPILVLEELMVTMSDVEHAAKQARRSGPLSLVVIDYAQYVAGEASAKTPRFLQVGEIGERAVALSIEIDCPVLVASQVNVMQEGKRRTYTFRETQKLQHAAHNVLILDVQWDQDQHGQRVVDLAEIVCEKQRSYAPFRLRVNFEPHLYRISEWREWAAPNQIPLLPPPVPA